MTDRPPLPRVVRLLGRTLLVAAGLLVLVVLIARVVVQGPVAAALVEAALPKMRGQLTLGGLRWNFGTAWAALRGHPADLQLEQLRVTDPEGTPVLGAQRLSVAVQVQRRPLQIRLHRLNATGGLWRMAPLARGRGYGFSQAFLPPGAGERRTPVTPDRPTRSSGSTRPAGVLFSIVDADLRDTRVELGFPAWGLVLDGADARGSLEIDGRTSAVPTFAFDARQVQARKPGRLRVGVGPRALELPLSRATITRVAIPRDAPTQLVLDAVGHTGRSQLGVRGTFAMGRDNGRLPRPGMKLQVTLDRAADALNAIARERRITDLAFDGDSASLQASFDGPYRALAHQVRVDGLHLAYSRHRVRDLHLDGNLQIGSWQATLNELRFEAADGGRVSLRGQLDPSRKLELALRIEALQTGPHLPPALQLALGGVLDGTLRARADLNARSASLDELDLALRRSSNRQGPGVMRVHHGAGRGDRGTTTMRVPTIVAADGELRVPRLSLPLLGGRVTLGGRAALWDPRTLRLRPPQIDATLDGRGLDLKVRLGTTVMATLPADLRARVRGSLDDLAVALSFPGRRQMQLLGVPYQAPARVAFTYLQGEMDLPPVRFDGEGRLVRLRGRVTAGKQIDAALVVRGHPLAPIGRMAQVALPLSGSFDADLRLGGTLAAPEPAGNVVLRAVSVQGLALGDGTVTLTPTRTGGVTFMGPDFGVARAEGQLQPMTRSGRLAVHLNRMPFARAFPELADWVDGRATGTLELVVSEQSPPHGEARLTELAVDLRPPAGSGGPPLSLAARGPLRVTVDERRVRLWPARFTAAGAQVNAQAELAAGVLRAQLDGRVPIAPFLAFAGTPLASAEGAVGATLSIERSPRRALARGTLSITEPLTLRPRDLPVDLVVPRGTVRLQDQTARLERLDLVALGETLRLEGAVTVDGRDSPALDLSAQGGISARLLEKLSPLITTARGRADLYARLTGTVSRPSMHGRVELGRTELRVRGMTAPLTVHGGLFELDDEEINLSRFSLGCGPHGLITIGANGSPPARLQLQSLQPLQLGTLDVPIVGRRVALSMPPFELKETDLSLTLSRARGSPLRLAGEVHLGGVRLDADLAQKQAPALRAMSRDLGGPAAVARGVRAARAPRRRPFPEVRLDLRVRSAPGAIVVAKKNLPDPHLGIDYQVRGTLLRPELVGKVKASDLYSLLALLAFKLAM